MAASTATKKVQPPAAPSSNRNAYAGANIGVPWSPLEGVTSLDPRDYVWAAPPAQDAAAQAAWQQLGLMAMLQAAWPVGMPAGVPAPGAARGMAPACLPGFPMQFPGQWNTLQQGVPVDCSNQGQAAGTAAQKGKAVQASGQHSGSATRAAGGRAAEGQKVQKSGQKQKKGKAEVLSAAKGGSVDKCSDDFLDCVMDINEEDLQQLLQEPLDTLVQENGHVQSHMDGACGHLVSENSDVSSVSLHKVPSWGSQHSETLPDNSTLFLDDLDLSCLKEVNSFPDLTDLECLKFDAECTDAKEGSGKASMASGQLRKKKGGVSKKRGARDKPAVLTFVDDECLKELEQMLGTGVSAEVLGDKLKGAGSVLHKVDATQTIGSEKSKGNKATRRNGGRKTPRAS